MSKISALTPLAGAPSGNEQVVMVASGATRRGGIGPLVAALAQPYVDQAQQSALVAQAAAELAFARDIFASAAAGIVGTEPGTYFFTPGDEPEDFLVLWLHGDEGEADEISRSISRNMLAALTAARDDALAAAADADEKAGLADAAASGAVVAATNANAKAALAQAAATAALAAADKLSVSPVFLVATADDQADFTLPFSPTLGVLLFIDGVLVEPDDYTILGTALSLDQPVALGQRLRVLPFQSLLAATVELANVTGLADALAGRAARDLSNIPGFIGIIEDFEGSDKPGITHAPLFWTNPNPTTTDGADHTFRRNFPAGGTGGQVNASMRHYGQTDPDTTSLSWVVLSVLFGYSNFGEDVAHYPQTHKYGQGHHSASCHELIDHIYNPLRGSVTVEFDASVEGVDNTDALGNRHTTHFVARGWQGETGVEVTSHCLFTTEAGTHLRAIFKRGAGGGTVDKIFDFPDFQLTFDGKAETRRMTIGRAGGAVPTDYGYRLSVDGSTIFNLYGDAGNNTVLAAGGVAQVVLNGASGYFGPLTNNVTKLGGPGKLWSEAYLANPVINTSDATLKTALRVMTDDELDAIGDVQVGIYQWLDAIAEKGEEGARLHAGALAQQLQAAFAGRGLDATRYAWWCADPVMEIVMVDQPVLEQASEIVIEQRPVFTIEDGKAVRRLVDAPSEPRLLWDELPVFDEAGDPVILPAQEEQWGLRLKHGAPKGSDDPADYERLLVKPGLPERPLLHPVPRMVEIIRPVAVDQPKIDPATGEPMVQLGIRYSELLVALHAWSRREHDRARIAIDALAARLSEIEARP